MYSKKFWSKTKNNYNPPPAGIEEAKLFLIRKKNFVHEKKYYTNRSTRRKNYDNIV